MKLVNSENKSNILFVLTIIMIVFLFVYIFIVSYSLTLTSNYKNIMYPNVYIGNYNISNLNISELENKVNKIENDLQTKKIVLVANDREFEYSLLDLGITIDKDKMIKEIKDYHSNMSYSKKIYKIFSDKKKVFSYKINYNENDLKKFINNLKNIVDVVGQDGKLVMGNDRNLSYQEAIPPYSLNVDKTYVELIKFIKKGCKNGRFNLIGDINEFKESELLKTIDTKVASYSTKYSSYISRGRNLETALNYLDGAIVNSGEVFSYFDLAGPYYKKGYVFYYNMIGSGTCQIATTIYNTALLSGVEIVERHQHQKYNTYVPGGQDATVVSSGNANLLDFKFKNTYKYPIYISAYYGGGVATVEFWSNSNAKEGKEYKVSSVPLGNLTYETYLHTYQNGVEIDKKFIAKTHYTGVS